MATDATVILTRFHLVVGTRTKLDEFERGVGQRSDEELLLQTSGITLRRVIVTDGALGRLL